MDDERLEVGENVFVELNEEVVDEDEEDASGYVEAVFS